MERYLHGAKRRYAYEFRGAVQRSLRSEWELREAHDK
jgi:hypothetical protein